MIYFAQAGRGHHGRSRTFRLPAASHIDSHSWRWILGRGIVCQPPDGDATHRLVAFVETDPGPRRWPLVGKKVVAVSDLPDLIEYDGR